MTSEPARFRLVRYTVVTTVMVLLLLEATLRALGDFTGDLTLSLDERYERWRQTTLSMLEERKDALTIFDPNLGWRPQPNLSDGPNVINEHALRNDAKYTVEPPLNVVRIAAFGDSFVYGSGVNGDEAWPSVLEQLTEDIEVLNYGVPGYGPDQAYLRFVLEGRNFGPQITIFGVTTPSLRRILTRSAVFTASPHFIAKPRFILGADENLVLLPNPIRQLSDANRYLEDPSALRQFGEFDYWYEPLMYENLLFQYSATARAFISVWSNVKRRYLDSERPLIGNPGLGVFNSSSRAFRILQKILESYRAIAKSWGAHPVIVILPDGYSVQRSRSGLLGIMDPVVEYCVDQQFECTDVTAAFLAQPVEAVTADWFVDGFHYSIEGNRIVAEWLAKELLAGVERASMPR